MTRDFDAISSVNEASRFWAISLEEAKHLRFFKILNRKFVRFFKIFYSYIVHWNLAKTTHYSHDSFQD